MAEIKYLLAEVEYDGDASGIKRTSEIEIKHLFATDGSGWPPEASQSEQTQLKSSFCSLSKDRNVLEKPEKANKRD